MRVEIPTSKSCYARIAMISAIAGIAIPYCDENDDIIVIREALQAKGGNVWVGSSGTAARFAIAYYASQDCEVVIDGSEQMRKRPISSIIEAAREMGAEVEGDGLPLRIKGRIWTKDEVTVDASQSSQTVSALMLAGMRNGLTIKTRGERNSWSYVALTADIMGRYGVKVEIDDEQVRVGKMGDISPNDIAVEKDWSSAVFWYGWCATRGDEIVINGLSPNSVQPDSAAIAIFGRLGVESEDTAEGIRIRLKRKFDFDDVLDVNCRRCPDLAMVLIPTLCVLGRKFVVRGLDTLDRKESRRGRALCCELKKSGYMVEWNGSEMSGSVGTGSLTREWSDGPANLSLLTHDDHRMVMAHLILGNEVDCAPLTKSYPGLKHFYAKKFGGEQKC